MFIKIPIMRLHIAPNKLISSIQAEFTNEFPFLKLEFFSKKALLTGDYSASQLVPGEKKIGDIQGIITDGLVEIDGEMKVKELEDHLKNEFNVAAQVFRKSGNLWLETTMTDNWTLNQQTKHGQELSTGINYNEEASDYDLNRDAAH